MMLRMCLLAILGILAASGLLQSAPIAQEPVIGGPCEGCDAVFYGQPDTITSMERIAPVGEPGQPLIIEGIVRDVRGRPAVGIIVYAYHTDNKGLYPYDKAMQDQHGVRHGKLRGWAKTDASGRYRFDTIRPAGYPGTDIPQHIHMHIIEPGRGTYYIDDILFDDDPRLTAEQRRHLDRGRGGSGIVKPTKDAAGHWRVKRDIELGKNIPGYQQ